MSCTKASILFKCLRNPNTCDADMRPTCWSAVVSHFLHKISADGGKETPVSVNDQDLLVRTVRPSQSEHIGPLIQSAQIECDSSELDFAKVFPEHWPSM